MAQHHDHSNPTGLTMMMMMMMSTEVVRTQCIYTIFCCRYLNSSSDFLLPSVSFSHTTVVGAFLAILLCVQVGRWCDEAAQTVYRTEQLVRTEHNLEFAKVKVRAKSLSQHFLRIG